MKLDILAIGIHPDDVELSCGGTIAKHVSKGYQVGILDLTKGEMGSRGDEKTREEESEAAKKILNVAVRETLNLPDVWIANSQDTILKIIPFIRFYKPKIILINAPQDRHPNHTLGHQVAKDACFFAGLTKVQTLHRGEVQEAHRPSAIYSYIQSNFLIPDLVVDISDFFEIKMKAIQAYKTQFFNPGADSSSLPPTFISDPKFLRLIESKDQICGKAIGVKYAEGFLKERYIGVDDLTTLI